MNVYIYADWMPGEHTIGYYNFSDQNNSQITDFGYKGNNLTGNTMPSYVELASGKYVGNFANVSNQYTPNVSLSQNVEGEWTMVAWVMITSNSYCYIFSTGGSGQYAFVYGFNSGQIELYSYVGTTTRRVTIKSGVQLNTWYMIGATNSNGTSKVYCNGEYVGTMTSSNTMLNSITANGGNNTERLRGQLGVGIVEDRIWTDEGMRGYFRSTKAAYGIS